MSEGERPTSSQSSEVARAGSESCALALSKQFPSWHISPKRLLGAAKCLDVVLGLVSGVPGVTTRS